ncbi:hypothetical protein D3C79_1058230 [compost metagenome]
MVFFAVHGWSAGIRAQNGSSYSGRVSTSASLNGRAMITASSSPLRSFSRSTWVKFSSMYSGICGATRCN